MTWKARLVGANLTESKIAQLKNFYSEQITYGERIVTDGTTALSDLGRAKAGKGAECGISAKEYVSLEALLETAERDKLRGYADKVPKIAKSIEDAKIVKEKLDKYFSYKGNKENLYADIKEAEFRLRALELFKPNKSTLNEADYKAKKKVYDSQYYEAKRNLEEARENIISPKTIEAVDKLEKKLNVTYGWG